MKKGRLVFTRLCLMIICTIGLIALLIPMLKDYNFGLDLKGGFEVLYKVESMDGSEVTSDMVTSTYKTLSKRIDGLGVSEPVITIEGDDKIRVQLAGVTDKESARTLLSSAASLTFRNTEDELLMTADVLNSGGAKLAQDEYGNPAVSLSIKDKDQFYQVTKEISQKSDNRIVIWLDYEEGVDSFSTEGATCGSLSSSNCLSVASVLQGFSSDVIIQGDFTEEEARNLVDLINSGSLPTKLEEISSKTVAASFGENALTETYQAGILGVALIILLMIAIYRFAGLISGIAILIYSFVTLFVFWLVGGVLTLPGIAAVVIGIGMAIDAVVISYSRLKEELYKGTKLSMAYKEANKTSLKSIIDANVTTLIAAFLLFIFGESSVKGFATMLIISTFVTMIIMVALSRWLLGLFVKTGYFDERLYFFIGVKNNQIVSTYNKDPKSLHPFQKIDFIKIRKVVYGLFLVFLVVGAISLWKNKLTLGVDFKGGTSITINVDKPLEASSIDEDLKELNLTKQSMDQSGNTIYIKVNEVLEDSKVTETEAYFGEKYNAQTDIGVVSNVVQKELIKNALLSLGLSIVGIILYVSVRFRFNYAFTAVVALVHDVLFIVILFSLCKLEVESMFIAAVLSIVGYSINDTIVTFDRIRENRKAAGKIKNKDQLKDIINCSIRETLGRSIVTTLTTLIPVVCLILFGSKEILNFNLALLFGLVSGVYSSIFIASQLLYDLEKKNIKKAPKKKWYDDGPQELKIKGVNTD